jgi:hypothetical protein
MDEKHTEVWEVSLAFLQDHRKIATVGAHWANAIASPGPPQAVCATRNPCPSQSVTVTL